MSTPRNMLLRSLPPDQVKKVLAVAELVHLEIRDNVIEPNKPIQFVDFPETGLTSLVTQMDDGSLIEIATIGREGFVGSALTLGLSTIPDWAFCQVAGVSWRIQAKDFCTLLAESPELTSLCLRYEATLFNQVAKNTGCNWTHSIEQRCARWLLLTHDRVDGNQFYLTQEFLAMMLGVTRSGVNLAAGTLQKAGLITYVRGNITIVDREGLENATCSCYMTICKYFEQTFKSGESASLIYNN